MQILKGDIYKSVTVENLLKGTKSCCCVYDIRKLLFQNDYECYYVNSKTENLNQFKEFLQEYTTCMDNKKQFDYFIIYTNNTEEELFELIKWIKDNEEKFNCKCILLTCK